MTFPLADSAVLDDPFPFFRQCRQESPIRFQADWNAWFIFRHEDINALSRDPHLSAQRMDIFKQLAPTNLQDQLGFLETELRSMVVMLDGQEHLRVRQALQRGFTAQVIRQLEPAIHQHVEALLGEIAGSRSFDVAGQVCRKLPLLVLADLFALPTEDFPKLEKWAHDFVEYFNRNPVPESCAWALIRSGRELIDYTRNLIAERRAHPGDDFISTLAHAEVDGKALTNEEIIANVAMVIIAGNDTVGSALGNAVYLLLSHPDQLARVQRGETDWESAFEEALRFEPANPIILRKVVEDFEYAGNSFAQGQLVFLVLASGSRDEAFLDDPEHFNVGRSASRHMTFGAGAHFCIGAALARAEAQALLPRLFEKFRDLKLDPALPPEWLRVLGVRGPRVLPVTFAGPLT